MNLWSFGLAAFSGVLMALQGAVNAALSKVIGLWEATFVVHLVGTAVLALLLWVFKLGSGDLLLMVQTPWYSWTGGIISVGIIYCVAASIPTIGVGNATTAIVAAQVMTALVIDCTGVFGLEKLNLSWSQGAGVLLLAAGVKLLLSGR